MSLLGKGHTQIASVFLGQDQVASVSPDSREMDKPLSVEEAGIPGSTKEGLGYLGWESSVGGVAQPTPESFETDRLHLLSEGRCAPWGLGLSSMGAHTYCSLDSVCGSAAAGLWKEKGGGQGRREGSI